MIVQIEAVRCAGQEDLSLSCLVNGFKFVLRCMSQNLLSSWHEHGTHIAINHYIEVHRFQAFLESVQCWRTRTKSVSDEIQAAPLLLSMITLNEIYLLLILKHYKSTSNQHSNQHY